MVLHRRLLSAATAALLLGAAMARAEAPAPAQPKAVIELFTSQGCSSCPPADALFVELSKNPEVIALTLPVTYWDYLGWKDTLGKDSFAKRQKLYSKARGDGQLYTPQAVINGGSHLVGSDKADIERALKQAGAKGFAVKVALEEQDGALRIRLTPSGGGAETTAGVWVVPTTHMATVPIMRGENQGKTISYANVVRALVRVGDWNGAEAVLTAPLAATQAAEADGYVVIVQADQPSRYGPIPGAILGAARGKR